MGRRPKPSARKGKGAERIHAAHLGSVGFTPSLPKRSQSARSRYNRSYRGDYTPLSTPRSRAFGAKAAMRRKGWSLYKAADFFSTTPENVRGQFPGQFRKRGGRWVVKKTDSDLRTMPILTSDGYRDVRVRGSNRASQLGRLNWAQSNFAQGRDPEGRFLREFKGKKFGGYTAITDLDELTRLGEDRGEIRVDELGSDQITRGGR